MKYEIPKPGATPGEAEPLAAATYNMHDAKSNLSRLVDQAAAGNEIIIAKAGKPAARLVPLRPEPAKTGVRPLGIARGRFEVPDDFDDPLPAAMWGDLLDTAAEA